MTSNVTSQLQQTIALWQALWNNHLSRMETFYGETAKMYDQSLGQARSATEETNKLCQAWVDSAVTLTRDLQKLSIEGARKSLGLV